MIALNLEAFILIITKLSNHPVEASFRLGHQTYICLGGRSDSRVASLTLYLEVLMEFLICYEVLESNPNNFYPKIVH